jgi:hypothetical protein
MAMIVRKLRRQQRFKDVARSRIHAYGCGHVTGLNLLDGERGVHFTIDGIGSDREYTFDVAMTEAEWKSLQTTLNKMLEDSARDKERFHAGEPYEPEDETPPGASVKRVGTKLPRRRSKQAAKKGVRRTDR